MNKKATRKRKPVTLTLNEEVHIRIKEISEETDIPVSRLVDRALKSIVDEYDNKNK